MSLSTVEPQQRQPPLDTLLAAVGVEGYHLARRDYASAHNTTSITKVAWPTMATVRTYTTPAALIVRERSLHQKVLNIRVCAEQLTLAVCGHLARDPTPCIL